ncbi:MAG TPA: ZIP family metal transporter [Polyangia bacterium]|nr:ZIP family metal transporter [Polyangia bacterium]
MMLRTVAYVSVAVVVDGSAGLVGAFVPERRLDRSRRAMLGFAVGVLLGTTFLDLLPEAFAGAPRASVLGTIGGSFAIMASLEWTLGRRPRSSLKGGRLAGMLLGADAFHNAADGAAIAASFLISPRLGVITAVAVIAHEVPEELADYVVLRNAGLPRGRALLAMTGVQLTAAVGAALTLLSAAAWHHVAWVALGIAAGTFLYIAVADLLPLLWQSHPGRNESRGQAVASLLTGLALAIAETLW